MAYIQMCELCLRAYEPEEINGVRMLKKFDGWTVDLRLQEFRRVLFYGKPLLVIDFASPRGQEFLAQMHEAVTR